MQKVDFHNLDNVLLDELMKMKANKQIRKFIITIQGGQTEKKLFCQLIYTIYIFILYQLSKQNSILTNEEYDIYFSLNRNINSATLPQN